MLQVEHSVQITNNRSGALSYPLEHRLYQWQTLAADSFLIAKLPPIRGVDNFFEVGGLGVRVIPHATRGVWGHAPPGNFWLFRALRLLLVQSHWWKAS